ncbi:MAG: DUF1638 domain-containing protein [Kiritimatiellaeota bacterium]|nr:DUF1638 domain-containing protein [Kiritimatiellota bacterium]
MNARLPEALEPPRKVAVIACGVLGWNLGRLRRDGTTDPELLVLEFPAQLHRNPRELRRRLQQEIDRLDTEPGLDAIVVGYGVCGRGSVGLFARSVPLVLPRVQDCIGLFLGSHSRYMSEFRRRPGTRYMTQGWYERTVAAQPTADREKAATERLGDSLYGPAFEELAERFGAENARFICEFRDSWKRNYRRAAYIRFKGEPPDPPGQRITEGMSGTLGWEHQVIEGDESLLAAMLSGRWDDPRILVVPPGGKTVTAPGNAVFGYVAGHDSRIDELLERYHAGHERRPLSRNGLGLGIDTGGTYTDAVIYDFEADAVCASAKAPTTHEDLVIGIRDALEKLPRPRLAAVRRVGLSTTLATNAFIEAKGRPVGLLLMAPVAVDLDQLPFRFVRKLAGALSMDGEELAPLDTAEVRQAVREAVAAGCQALAISGFGSVVNPIHEKTAARIALEEGGLHTVCGHELSTHLNFIERATTAAMNARLIPLIEHLLDAVEKALAEFGVEGVPVMVVRGDGSQMLSEVARATPVETVLSGPAASVVGAARLSGIAEAVAIDMGGTTLDVARIHDGRPILSNDGARIGGFRTSVRAMATRTTGLGGDSEIDLSHWPRVRIGPRRILPVCRIRTDFPRISFELEPNVVEKIAFGPNCLDFVALAPGAETGDNPMLRPLEDGPLLLDELARRLNRPGARHIRWQDLETQGLIRRYGLTLTDLLHVEGRFTAFDASISQRLLDLWVRMLDADPQDILERVYCEFRRRVCNEALGAALPETCPWDVSDGLRDWMTAHLAEQLHLTEAESLGKGPVFKVGLGVPVIAVGAPVAELFPQVQPVLGTEVLVPQAAAVANALGAVAGDVMLRETAVIRVTEDGALLCSWRGGTARPPNIENALTVCEQAIVERLRERATANRIPFHTPEFTAVAHRADTLDGTVFLGVTLTAELKG